MMARMRIHGRLGQRYNSVNFGGKHTASLVANGWWKDPDTGMITQWGTKSSSSGGDVTITFPIAFPTAVLSVTGNAMTAASTAARFASFGTPTTTTVLMAIYNTSGAKQAANMIWIAVGY